MATPSGAADETTGPLRIQWFKQLLGMFPVGSLIDLGSGHGTFARLAADAGWSVTALDARGDRYQDDARIDWVIGDVRNADLGGYSVIGCLGLFYHLTVDDQLDLLKRCAGTPIILDTHVANDQPTPHRLSGPVTLDGYRGRLYAEPNQLAISTSSWNNDTSFWPDTDSLYRMLDEHGYDILTATPWYLPTRTFFLCLPRSSDGPIVNNSGVADALNSVTGGSQAMLAGAVDVTDVTSRYCPVCRTTTIGAFGKGPGGRLDASCPKCRSLERERFLAILLDCLAPILYGVELFVDVAPSPRTSVLYRALRPGTYVRLDVDPNADRREVDVQASLTHLPFADDSVAAMVCYHVLEHIPDDAAAMREIARALRADGLAIVQVPWRPSRSTDEDEGAEREERIRRFGQADHVRYYGFDFEDRLRFAGFDIRRVTPRTLIGPKACQWMNIRPEEAVWLLRPAGSPTSCDSGVQPMGALAGLIDQLLTHSVVIEDKLRVAREKAKSARRVRAEAQRWKQRYEDVHDHWVLRSYRRVARPAARILAQRRDRH